MPTSFVAGPIIVWSLNDTVYLEFPVGPVVETSKAVYARSGITMANNSGDAMIKPGVRVSTDKVTWFQNAMIVGTASRDSDGVTQNSGWAPLSVVVPNYGQYRYVQAVVLCKAKTGSNTATEMCLSTLDFDFSET